MRIVSWQLYMDYHQFHTWQRIGAYLGDPIEFMLYSELIPVRRSLGWDPIDLEKLNATIVGEYDFARRLGIMKSKSDAIHIFQSLLGVKKGTHFALILYALMHGIKVGIMLEPFSRAPVGYQDEEHRLSAHAKAFMRPAVYRLAALLINYASRTTKPCIFAISDIAKAQLRSCGFDRKSIFPYGYFIPYDDRVRRSERHARPGELRFVFMGSLLRIKGIDLAIEAVELLAREGWPISLDIYGAGPLHALLSEAGKSVRYKGLVAPEDAQRTIAGYDALLLPSRHDGWGVVVNEALLQGVPAIVSDRVGSSCLIAHSGAGVVFRSEDIGDLIARLRKMCEDNAYLADMKAKARTFPRIRILPETGADYFMKCLRYYFYDEGDRPGNIWEEIT